MLKINFIYCPRGNLKDYVLCNSVRDDIPRKAGDTLTDVSTGNVTNHYIFSDFGVWNRIEDAPKEFKAFWLLLKD